MFTNGNCMMKTSVMRRMARCIEPEHLLDSHELTQAHKLKLTSMALVRKRTTPIERPSLVGEVSVKFFFADRECRAVSATDPHAVNLGFLDPELLLFHSSSSSVILTRLRGPRSRPITSQKIWKQRESNAGSLDL
jgi:hypothetical protein